MIRAKTKKTRKQPTTYSIGTTTNPKPKTPSNPKPQRTTLHTYKLDVSKSTMVSSSSSSNNNNKKKNDDDFDDDGLFLSRLRRVRDENMTFAMLASSLDAAVRDQIIGNPERDSVEKNA